MAPPTKKGAAKAEEEKQLLLMIRDKKQTLFGAFSESLSRADKTKTWEEPKHTPFLENRNLSWNSLSLKLKLMRGL